MIRTACVVAIAGVVLADQAAVKPRPLIQWEWTNGPYGGEAQQLLVHRNELLAPGNGGVWRSSDRGASWRPANGRLVEGWGIAQAGADLFVHDSKGLHRTEIVGTSWVTCGALPSSARSDRRLVGAGGRVVYWIPTVGLFRSNDRCATWTPISVPWDLDPGPLELVVSRDSGTIVVMTVRGSFRTEDYGATWSTITSPRAETFASVSVGSAGFVIGTSDGIYRSMDGGVSWTQTAFPRQWVRHMVTALDGAIYASVTTQSGQLYRTTVVRSQDEGSTWTNADEGLSGYELCGLARDDVGFLYAAGDTGVYRLNRFGRWQHVGLPTFFADTLFATPWGDVYATAGPLGAQRTSNRGATWRPLLMPDRYAGPLGLTSGGDLLMTLSDGLHRSRDRGKTWLRVGLHRSVSAIFTVPSTTTILAGTDNGVFRSLDNGETWIERSIGLRSFQVTSFAAGDDGALYAGTVAGEGDGHVYRSTNNGNQWRLLAPEFQGGPVNAVVVLPNGDVIAAADQGIFRLPSDATKWQEATLSVRATALVLHSSGRLIAGTAGEGVYVSEDEGQTWTRANDGLRLLRIRRVAVAPDGYIYVATGRLHSYGGVSDPGGLVGVFRGRFLK